jgi:hypothetical protein
MLTGFAASITFDIISNSLRVVKTYCEVNATWIGYTEAVYAVIAADDIKGLFGLKPAYWRIASRESDIDLHERQFGGDIGLNISTVGRDMAMLAL